MHDSDLGSRSRGSRSLARGVVILWTAGALGLLALGGFAARSLAMSGRPVTVTVDGYTEELHSTRPDVASLLADLGVSLRPEDLLEPGATTPLSDGLHVNIQRARPALIAADGTAHAIYSQAKTAGQLLADAGVLLFTNDEIWLEGRERIAPGASLPSAPEIPVTARFVRPRAWSNRAPQPLRLSVRRAVPITIDAGGPPYTIYTTAATVGEALQREQLSLYLGDRVQPGLGSLVHAGMRIVIQPSRSVLVSSDGRTIRTRTRGQTVGNALAELGISVAGNDRVEPAMSDAIHDNLAIRVVRVQNAVRVERHEIPFASILVADDDLEIDNQRLKTAGEPGEYRKRHREIYEDGQMKSNVLLDEWVAAQPITRELAYGRKIVLRTIDTPEGPRKYWRKIMMHATAYSKSTAGVPTTVPWFGITRVGLPMRKGLVGVDPTVIPFYSNLYVPRYGIGLAADTGNGIQPRRIDLGYDDDNLESWYTWTWVYFLEPVPPPSQIRWVFPNWPAPPGR